jgi:aryl-alcohol dehydrogenase-like predicted oxidoreductase
VQTRSIGSVDVSVVGLGCNNFGGRIDAEATDGVVGAALEVGITLFDTAEVYGGGGTSEELLGRALGSRRDEVVIATKFGMEIPDRVPGGASPERVREAVEGSLRRLGTDRVDLYQLHRPDPDVPIAETLGALDELVAAGKVVEIGHSNLDAGQIDEAERVAAEACDSCAPRTGGACSTAMWRATSSPPWNATGSRSCRTSRCRRAC